MTNVVKLRKDQRTLAGQGNITEFGSTWMQHLRIFLQGKVRDAYHDRVNMGKLALKAGITPGTLSKLVHLETKHPRATTIDGIIDALNLYEEVGRQMIEYGRSRNSH